MNTLRAHSQKLSLTPQRLREEFPLSLSSQQCIFATRHLITQILRGHSKKLLVIVGPCSIHDPQSAKEYAERLKKLADQYSDQLLVVMRAYFEKPRTRLGWKGFITDPFLNGNYQIEIGLRKARQLLVEMNEIGIPTATEFLDPVIPMYLHDLISWAAVGARTSASPLHREIASALPMPIGFKNTIDGNIAIAVDAIKAASHSHALFSIDETGHPTILTTQGNADGHIVLRGSYSRSNYEAHDIHQTVQLLKSEQIPHRIIVDCSHGNSMKDVQQQKRVLHAITEQIQMGSNSVCGVMLESHLIGGKQTLQYTNSLVYGQSITDACLSWEETLPLLDYLATVQQKVIA